jgi:hypothetical protein
MIESEIIQNASDKASEILRIPNRYIDKVKFIQLYSLLFTMAAGDESRMRWWLTTHNNHLNFCPAAVLTDTQSLDKIISYLEELSR